MINSLLLKEKYCNSKILHVFVMTNPIQTLIINEFVNRLDILKKNIIIIDIRDLKIFSNASIIFNSNETITERIFKKIFGVSLKLENIKKEIFKRQQKYVLYVPWDSSYFFAFKNNNLCVGHVYIEEGDLSYWDDSNMMYELKKLSLTEIKRRSSLPAVNNIFNKSFEFVIVTNYKCFPKISKSDKFKINKFDYIPKIYNVSLKKDDRVGVLPTAMRLNKANLENICKYFKNYLCKGDYIKIHPSFYNYPHLRFKLFCLNKKMSNYFQILENEIILEAEIMHNPIHLFGLKSSLQRYSLYFGGTYTEIKELSYLQKGRV